MSHVAVENAHALEQQVSPPLRWGLARGTAGGRTLVSLPLTELGFAGPLQTSARCPRPDREGCGTVPASVLRGLNDGIVSERGG